MFFTKTMMARLPFSNGLPSYGKRTRKRTRHALENFVYSQENITRESGAEYGQALTVAQFREAIESAGRVPVQRTTTYEFIKEDAVRS